MQSGQGKFHDTLMALIVYGVTANEWTVGDEASQKTRVPAAPSLRLTQKLKSVRPGPAHRQPTGNNTTESRTPAHRSLMT